MCLSNTLEKEKQRFDRLALKLKEADGSREEKVARAVVNVFSCRYHQAEKAGRAHMHREFEHYVQLVESMKADFIPRLPNSVQYRVYF